MWSGSTLDEFIRGTFELKQALHQWDRNVWLLGDSGYPCKRRLLAPFRNPSAQEEERYNSSYIRTRNIIEKCFGVWKNRFRCLDCSGRCLQYSVEQLPEESINIYGSENHYENNDIEGVRLRREIVERHFI